MAALGALQPESVSHVHHALFNSNGGSVALLPGLFCPSLQNQTGSNMTASAWMNGLESEAGVLDETNASNSVSAQQQDAAATAGDVSTERRPGAFTKQQVPKNLTELELRLDGGGVDADGDPSLSSASAGLSESASKGASKAAEAAIGGLDNALPLLLPGVATQAQAAEEISKVFMNVTSNFTDGLTTSTRPGPARQQLERVLQDGLDAVNDKSSSLHGNQDVLEVSQSSILSKRLYESTRMSQYFGLFGAVLVFGLWVLHRRRRPHTTHHEPGLLGPGVHQGAGGWLRPRPSKHRLATD